MGEKMGPDGLTTHGICPDCLARVEAERVAIRQTFEAVPVVLPDHKMRGRKVIR
jgi:hypothetical protein